MRGFISQTVFKKPWLPTVGLGLVFGVLFFTGFEALNHCDPCQGWLGLATAANPKRPIVASSAAALGVEEQRTMALYQRLSPAVVNITSTSIKLDSFLNPVPQQGQGSGVILTPDGYVLTNYHVIENAKALEVSLLGHPQPYPAQIVGADAGNDIALLKINPIGQEPFPTVPVGDSNALQVGQSVLAIGNPFGLHSTLTTGVISSLGRRLQTESGRQMEGIIQTDAAINPGNSGGALLDSNGRLIAINTAIFSPSGASNGIGFAIPANTAVRIANDLIEFGRIIRPYVGLSVGLEVSPRLASMLKLGVDYGLMVAQVNPGGPASKAGIEGGTQTLQAGMRKLVIGGDIIVQLNEHKVETADGFLNLLETYRPGDTVTLTVVRGTLRLKIPVILQERQP